MLYDALGERISKTTGSTTTYFAYDLAGRLIGEYDGTGALIQEIVWMGDTPVATMRLTNCGLGIFYIHTDHLNTPRLITRRSTADIVWRWDSGPFGDTAPNQNPSGLGTFAFNLRFPGQYYDAETGQSYNMRRDYDPAVGRYAESDPVGLRAGVNTYSYASANPLTDFDPMGLCKVELRFKHVWNTGGWLGWHAYVVTTDPNGSETISRGGPAGSNAYSPWGNIYAHQDPYDSNSKDWQTDPSNSWDHRVDLVVSQDNAPCNCTNKRFASVLDAITNAQLPYYPFDMNSNAVVGTMLRDSGFNMPSVPVFAPGFGADLNLNYVPSGMPLVSPW